MLRMLGAGMIMTGCFGLGLQCRAQMRGRLQSLRKLAEILELFAGEIRYGRSTLPECCGQLGESLEMPYGPCFARIAACMEEGTGISFAVAYQKYMQECLNQLPITRADKRILLQVFAESDTADIRMQERALTRRAEALGETIRDLEAEQKEKSKMAVGLGAMSGILLVILLL